MNRVRRLTTGLTLVETLVVCAILALLLVVAGSLGVQAKRAGAHGERSSEMAQIRELAAETLRQHLESAGFRGTGPAPAHLGGAPLEVMLTASASGSDAFTVRYLENRWYSTPQVRTLRLSTGRDGNGMWNLYLQEEGATRQPAVQGVRAFRVRGFLAAGGTRLGRDTPLPATVRAIELDLVYDWDETQALLVRLPVERHLSREGAP